MIAYTPLCIYYLYRLRRRSCMAIADLLWLLLICGIRCPIQCGQ